jgi:hypothetical protein
VFSCPLHKMVAFVVQQKMPYLVAAKRKARVSEEQTLRGYQREVQLVGQLQRNGDRVGRDHAAGHQQPCPDHQTDLTNCTIWTTKVNMTAVETNQHGALHAEGSSPQRTI